MVPVVEIDLRTVILQGRQGNPDAIGDLYAAYAAPLRRYCLIRLGDHEAANDCVQDVFVRVWGAIKTFEYRDDSAFNGWLYTIAHNVVVKYLRTRNRRRQFSMPLTVALIDPASVDLTRTVCERIVLYQAYQQLTRKQQHLLLLKFIIGLSNREIAVALGQSEGAVKLVQYRALRRLSQLINDQDVRLTTTRSAASPTGVR